MARNVVFFGQHEGGLGGRHRREPIGGSAKGMPKNAATATEELDDVGDLPAFQIASTSPHAVVTVGGDGGGDTSEPATKESHKTIAHRVQSGVGRILEVSLTQYSVR